MTFRYLQPMYRYSPCRHSTCNDSGLSATNFQKYSFWFLFSPLRYSAVAARGVSVHGQYRFVTYRSQFQLCAPIAWRGSVSISTKVPQGNSALLTFWYRNPHQNRLHLFLPLNAQTAFLKFKGPGPFKLTFKTSAIVYEVKTVRLVPLLTPLSSG